MIKRTGERVIFKTKLFEIKDIDLELPDGSSVTYQILEKGHTALIVPVTADNKLILIKEYFYAIDEYMFSFPKGRIDKGYKPEEIANKELQEEAGFKSNKIEELGVLTSSPGYITQRTHVFLAQDLEESKLEGDEIDEIEVKEFTFEEVEKMIISGEINESRTISAFYLAKNYLEGIAPLT